MDWSNGRTFVYGINNNGSNAANTELQSTVTGPTDIGNNTIEYTITVSNKPNSNNNGGSQASVTIPSISWNGKSASGTGTYHAGDTLKLDFQAKYNRSIQMEINGEGFNPGDKLTNSGDNNIEEFTLYYTIPSTMSDGSTLNITVFDGWWALQSLTISKAEDSAFASPFQMAFDPFVAHAADYDTYGNANSVATVAGGITPPTGYHLDADWGKSILVTRLKSSRDVENLPVLDEHGNEYYYAIVEKDVPAGYTVSYSPGGDKPEAVAASALKNGTITTLTATNTYTYTSATPHAVKMLDGVQFNGYLSDGTTPATFTFTIRQISPEGSDYQQTVTTAADGTITFPSIEYHEAGDRIYEISEAVGTDKNIVYTTSKVYWKVFVTGTNGVLTATDRYYVNAVCNTPTNPDNVAQFENHELTHVDIFKQWSLNTADAVDEYPGAGTPPVVRVHLWRKGEGGKTVEIDSATGKPVLSNATATPYKLELKDGKWQLRIDNLDKFYGNRQPYEYYIVEDPENLQGWTPTRYRANNGNGSNQGSDNTVTGGGELTVVNSMSQVALPATGGAGTTAIYAAGAGLVLLALAGWLLAARKRRDF